MRRTVLSLVSLALLCGSASARIVERWDYKKLLAKSDLVVIATALDSVVTTDEDAWGSILLAGRNTRFKVQSVLKGDPADGPITVLHFQVKLPETRPGQPGPIGVVSNNGPTTLNFKTDSKDGKSPGGIYLLYLRATADGRYEPVSGRIDPEFSVRSLHAAPIAGFDNPFDDADGPPSKP